MLGFRRTLTPSVSCRPVARAGGDRRRRSGDVACRSVEERRPRREQQGEAASPRAERRRRGAAGASARRQHGSRAVEVVCSRLAVLELFRLCPAVRRRPALPVAASLLPGAGGGGWPEAPRPRCAADRALVSASTREHTHSAPFRRRHAPHCARSPVCHPAGATRVLGARRTAPSPFPDSAASRGVGCSRTLATCASRTGRAAQPTSSGLAPCWRGSPAPAKAARLALTRVAGLRQAAQDSPSCRRLPLPTHASHAPSACAAASCASASRAAAVHAVLRQPPVAPHPQLFAGPPLLQHLRARRDCHGQLYVLRHRRGRLVAARPGRAHAGGDRTAVPETNRDRPSVPRATRDRPRWREITRPGRPSCSSPTCCSGSRSSCPSCSSSTRCRPSRRCLGEGRVRVVGRGGRPRAVSGDLGRSRGVGRACAAEPRESASRGLPGPAWPRAARALGGVAARPASVGGGSAGRDAFGAAE